MPFALKFIFVICARRFRSSSVIGVNNHYALFGGNAEEDSLEKLMQENAPISPKSDKKKAKPAPPHQDKKENNNNVSLSNKRDFGKKNRQELNDYLKCAICQNLICLQPMCLSNFHKA